jgi:fructose-1,6-bisphosphatase/inositol monophosphatase family enzyme
VAGLIYDPVGRDWLVSIRGEGAEGVSATGARRPLRAASAAPLAEMTGVTSWYLLPEPERSRAVAAFAKVKATFAYRCAAYEYRIIAEGHCHFAFQYHLNPWDHAAGVLIHKEAGGYAALFDGSPYSVARHEGGIISAPDKESWMLLRKTFLG